MSYRQISVYGIKIKALKNRDIWKIIDYLKLSSEDIEEIVGQLLYCRFAPLLLEKSDSRYNAIAISSVYFLSSWERFIREYASLNIYTYYDSVQFMYSKTSLLGSSIINNDFPIEDDIIGKIICNLEECSFREADDIIVETIKRKYLPLILDREDPRFRLASIASVIAFEKWGNTIRHISGMPPRIPTPSRYPFSSDKPTMYLSNFSEKK